MIQKSLIACLLFTATASWSATEEKKCLQAVVLAEARGTDRRTMQAVADVVVNRARKQKTSVCKVVKQPGQFANIKKIYAKLEAGKNKQSQKDKNKDRDLKLSATIASKTLNEGSTNKNLMFFHTKKRTYAWTRKLKLVKQDKYHRYYAVAE